MLCKKREKNVSLKWLSNSKIIPPLVALNSRPGDFQLMASSILLDQKWEALGAAGRRAALLPGAEGGSAACPGGKGGPPLPARRW